jgi:hypothetical protein
MPVPREQMVEELRKAKLARDLLSELERRLKEENNTELEGYLTQLEQLAQSYPEEHTTRLLIESAVGSARTRRTGISSSDVSRSRSSIEGEISTLGGATRSVEARSDT